MPVEIRTRTAPPARGTPSEVDALFAIGVDTALPAGTVKQVRSIADYELTGATRVADPLTYDGLDNYFREGGKRAFVVKKAADVATTLPLFTEDFGGGQVTAWSLTPAAADYTALIAHAKANKRFALLDVKATDDTLSELTTTAGTFPTTDAGFAAGFGPWPEIPAPSGVTGGGTRTVPASSTVAALLARSDGLGNPNRAPAGRDFPLQYATGLSGPVLSDADGTALRAVGLNPLREKFGLMTLDGFQTKIVSSPDDPFWQANCARGRMWLQWRSTDVGLAYEYKNIDGRGRLARALQTDLEALCKSLWDVDGLYGDSPSEAYAVEVGTAVNTAASIAYGELHASVEVRFSLHARLVVIELVTVPITGRVSA
jgi:hypothetical protein